LIPFEAKHFIWVHVATLHEQLLQFEQLKSNVVIFLQELMLVLCLLQLEVLITEGVDSGLLVCLEILQLIGRFDQEKHLRFEFCGLLVCSTIFGELQLVRLFVILPVDKCLQVITELLVSLETLENVVSRHEVLLVSVDGLLQRQVLLQVLGTLEHTIELVEPD